MSVKGCYFSEHDSSHLKQGLPLPMGTKAKEMQLIPESMRDALIVDFLPNLSIVK
jgi:hypothetical protein